MRTRPWLLSRVRLRILKPTQLRKLLRQAVDTHFYGSVIDAAKGIEISQPTLWRVMNQARSIEARTKTALRKLVPELDEAVWESYWFSLEDRAALTSYERAIDAECQAHSLAYGLAAEGDATPRLSEAAERQIERFLRWATQMRHHPARIRLAVLRIRAPFFLGAFSRGGEPADAVLRDKYATDVRVVELGIRREKLLLQRRPAFVV